MTQRALIAGVSGIVGNNLASHLISKGCQRIAHIGGDYLSTASERLAGYRSALFQHGFESLTWRIRPGGSLARAIRKMLRQGHQPCRHWRIRRCDLLSAAQSRVSNATDRRRDVVGEYGRTMPVVQAARDAGSRQ